MNVIIRTQGEKVWLEVGYGGWAGHEAIRLYGTGADLAKRINGVWDLVPVATLAFADWIQEEIEDGRMQTVNQFRQPDRAWWDALPDLIRAKANPPKPVELPRWA